MSIRVRPQRRQRAKRQFLEVRLRTKMPPRIYIELFTSSHCNRCDKAKALLQKLIDELGCDRFAYRVVDIVDELDYAVELGVLNTTAITIEGELMFSSMPSKKKLRDALRKRLDALPP